MHATDLANEQPAQGWYARQLPLDTMCATPLALVTKPEYYNMNSAPVQFVEAAAPVSMAQDYEREKGVVIGPDSYTPCYPVVVQAVAVPSGEGAAVVAQAMPVQATTPEGETMARD